MKFLALTGLETALLAIATAGAIVALYFLKLRHRRLVIPSSLLWQRVLERREERSLWEKLRRILSVLLAVAIGLLMVFAVARPQIASLTGAAAKTLIVLDTSPSMLARMGDGRTRWQHATEAAKALLKTGGAGLEFRVADTSGQFDMPFTSDAAAAQRTIDNMRPVASTASFPEVDEAGTQVILISDGVSLPAVPNGVRRISVFEPASNAGITAFEVRSAPSAPLAFEAYLEVTNFGKEARKTSITISGAGPERITRDAVIPPGQSFSDLFDLSKFAGGGIRAAIQSDGDALAADDVAYAYLPLNKKARTLLVTKGNTYLQTALRLDSYVDLSVVDPKEYREDPAVDAYVFDGFAPAVQPARPALIIGAQSVPWLKSPTGMVDKPEFSTWTEDHPVMQYLSLHDVSISRAAKIDAANLTVLAASGQKPQIPLIVASSPTATGPRWIELTFDLQSSDFPSHESFPVFIDNVLTWFGRDQLALPRTTGIVEVPILNAQISGPDGKAVASQAYIDRTVFDAPETGLYVATTGGHRQYIAVNLTNRQYLDINRSTWTASPAVRLALPFFQHEPWFYLLGLAVVLLILEWFTYHHAMSGKSRCD